MVILIHWVDGIFSGKRNIYICKQVSESNMREYSTIEKTFTICGVYYHDIYFANQHD